MKKRVVITGMGVVHSLSMDIDTFGALLRKAIMASAL